MHADAHGKTLLCSERIQFPVPRPSMMEPVTVVFGMRTEKEGR